MKCTIKPTVTYEDDRPGYDPALDLLVGDIRNVDWTSEDENKVYIYYGNVNTNELAKQLGRSRASLASKVREMGLKFSEGKQRYQEIMGKKKGK